MRYKHFKLDSKESKGIINKETLKEIYIMKKLSTFVYFINYLIKFSPTKYNI